MIWSNITPPSSHHMVVQWPALQILLALQFEESRKIYADGLALFPEQGDCKPGEI